MPNTNKLYGLHWGIAFGVPFVVLVLLLVLGALCLVRRVA